MIHDLVRPTHLCFDIDRLRTEWEEARCLWAGHLNLTDQLSLVHSDQADSAEGRISDGNGRLNGRHPSEFNRFNEDFKGTYLEEVHTRVSDWARVRLGQHIGRTRFMVRRPYTCYSMHQDLELRLHIAVHTNPNCFFLFRFKESVNGHEERLVTYQVPVDGKAYVTETTVEHTLLNAGQEDRVHLVFEPY